MLILTIIFTLVIFIVILFQIALVLGAPWGEYTMSGKFKGKLLLKIRVIVLVQIIILTLLTAIVFIKSGIILNHFYNFSLTAIWFVSGFFLLTSFLNLITPSKKERNIWAPVSILLFIISLILALN